MADPISWMAVSAVVSTGISFLFPSEGPRLGDLRVSASTYGNMISEVYGTCRVGGNMIWNNPIREQKKKKRQGKGGSFYNEYTYYCDFAMGYCKGPLTNFRRLWADGKLIYDATGASEAFSTGEYRMRRYLGTEEQLPDSLIMASKGADNTPGYRGLAYIVFDNMPLKDWGNRIPQMAAEVFAPAGEVEQTPAPVFTYTELPESGLDSWVDGWNDYDNGYRYLYSNASNGTGKSALSRVRIDDGVTDRVVFADEMGFPLTSDQQSHREISRFLGVGLDGRLLVSFGSVSNASPIGWLDPTTMTLAGYVGRAAIFPSGINDPPINLDHPQIGAVPAAAALDERSMAFLGNFGVLYFIDMEKSQVVGRQAVSNGWGIFADGIANAYHVLTKKTGGCTLTTYGSGGGPGGSVITLNAAEVKPGATQIIYRGATLDESSPGLVLFAQVLPSGADFAAKFSFETNTIAWITPLKYPPPQTISNSRLTNGEISWFSSDRLFALNTSTGEWIDRDADGYSDIEDDYDQNDGSEGIFIPDHVQFGSTITQGYDSVRNVIVGLTAKMQANIATSGSVSLGSIVGAILRMGSLTSKNYDLTAINGIRVRGYGWASATDVKSIIDELKRLYLFDLVETGGKLVARLRSANSIGSVNFTIPQNVLGSSSDDAMDYWKETRLSEADLPERVTLAYMNIDDDFETSTASSIRVSNPIPTMFSRQQVQLQINLVATPTEAKDIVHNVLYSQWLERTKHETRLPWAYLDMDPSDTFKTVMNDGRSYYDRVHMTEVGANYAIEIEAYGQDSGAYDAETVADGGGAGRIDRVTLAKPGVPFVLNTPLLRDTDDTAGAFSLYYTALGQSAVGQFNGATMFRSVNSLDYDELYAEDTEVEWGSVVGIVPPPEYGFEALDWKTQITIRPNVKWFDISSITDDELWAGANMVVVGDEVLQFRDAVENTDGTWTISNLLRGRRGTEYACNLHRRNERFVFLDTLTIATQGEVSSAKNATRYFKAVTPGRSLNATAPIKLAYQPRDLMPYAPAQLRRIIEPNGDMTLTWERRTRLGGNMVDGTGEVPLSETEERYELYLLKGLKVDPSTSDLPASPEDTLRVVNLTSPSFTYTTAMQAEDGHVTDVDTLVMVVYQISGVVGRGFPAIRLIAPDRDF